MLYTKILIQLLKLSPLVGFTGNNVVHMHETRSWLDKIKQNRILWTSYLMHRWLSRTIYSRKTINIKVWGKETISQRWSSVVVVYPGMVLLSSAAHSTTDIHELAGLHKNCLLHLFFFSSFQFIFSFCCCCCCLSQSSTDSLSSLRLLFTSVQ